MVGGAGLVCVCVCESSKGAMKRKNSEKLKDRTVGGTEFFLNSKPQTSWA